ncbi:expressed unknown protein [Seminavis robusta]|uniref:Fatty acid hydroxylase domain-containing protein n=1 Tax=Seminavis robusta TaxID=568900 RepID=A0A9N8HJA1_9STRA|nr:expressed unknown protein [Seminavis robusta]|eukprot:Sro679_g186060.1 n/a (257) ;mRNA; r:12200-12970
MIDTAFFLQSGEIQESFLAGSKIAAAILTTLVVLEILSYDTVMALYKRDKKLYLEGLAMNFVNHIAFGIPIYVASSQFLMRKDETHASALAIIAQIVGILLIHSICFYELHKTFHTVPGYYKYHKFHHRYNTYTPPSAASAVSVVEYLVAYMGPFAVAGAIIRPYMTAFHASILIVAAGNVLEHTPFLEDWSQKYMPVFWVTTRDHLEHHRKLNVHFAAPTFDIDWVVERFTTTTTTGTCSTPSSPSSPTIEPEQK